MPRGYSQMGVPEIRARALMLIAKMGRIVPTRADRREFAAALQALQGAGIGLPSAMPSWSVWLAHIVLRARPCLSAGLLRREGLTEGRPRFAFFVERRLVGQGCGVGRRPQVLAARDYAEVLMLEFFDAGMRVAFSKLAIQLLAGDGGLTPEVAAAGRTPLAMEASENLRVATANWAELAAAGDAVARSECERLAAWPHSYTPQQSDVHARNAWRQVERARAPSNMGAPPALPRG